MGNPEELGANEKKIEQSNGQNEFQESPGVSDEKLGEMKERDDKESEILILKAKLEIGYDRKAEEELKEKLYEILSDIPGLEETIDYNASDPYMRTKKEPPLSEEQVINILADNELVKDAVDYFLDDKDRVGGDDNAPASYRKELMKSLTKELYTRIRNSKK